ncbi:hypothetical protein Tco_0474583 [Tanacetum coccineum]
MSMTIQSSVKDKILATSSETSKVKANVVIEALSRKERVKPRRVRAMAMTIQYGVRGMILTAQSEAFKQENVPLVGSEWSRPMTIKIEMDDLPRGFGRRYRKVLRTVGLLHQVITAIADRIRGWSIDASESFEPLWGIRDFDTLMYQDDEEVLNELSEYENARTLRRERIINSLDGDELAFECMIGFRKFTAYLDPFLPMNIISRKAYNKIMVDRLEGMGKNLVAIVRDVYVFVGSFTYITDFVVLEDKRIYHERHG